jgi:phosphoribosyl 1,2-cyclic phosphodiesterase
MRFQVLASGSGGNSLFVESGDLRILVDAGLPPREQYERLEAARIDPSGIDHVLVTHGHLDHARSAGQLARAAGAVLHCSQALFHNGSIRRHKRRGDWSPGRPLDLEPRSGRGHIRAQAVLVPHDAEPTYAVRLESQGRVLGLVTDLGSTPARLDHELSGCHALILEFNHDPELLAAGPYSAALKRRIAGPRGHLSNQDAAALLRRLAGPGLGCLVLAHLSQHNNRPELAAALAAETLGALGLGAARLEVARQDQALEFIEV